MSDPATLTPLDRIEGRILLIRGHRVLIDVDLAALYGVSTKRLNQQVNRNSDRFPEDFMFQLTTVEASALRLQFATSKKGSGGRRYLPYAFTEHGAIMAANVLNSHRAVQASVLVVRAFVRLRRLLSTHRELARKLAELEERSGMHDGAIQALMKAIHDLIEAPPAPRRGRIGFHPPSKSRSTAE